MGRHHAADDYEDDPEEPDESDMDDDGPDEGAETVECPGCGRDVYESAERCPKCGHYVNDEDGRRTSHPKWVIWTAIAILAAIAYGGLRWGAW